MKLLPIVLACMPVILAQPPEAPKQFVRTTEPALLYKVEADYTAEAQRNRRSQQAVHRNKQGWRSGEYSGG